MGAIIKEIKSNHWFPRKEEVDEYIASKDKDKYKRERVYLEGQQSLRVLEPLEQH